MTTSDVTAADVRSSLIMAESLAALISPFLASETAQTLLARYREPRRHYHDVTHLQEILGHIAQVVAQFQQLRSVVYAALYHDAIYDPQRKDNEARSAELACHDLTGADLTSTDKAELLDETELTFVSELILATAAHGATLEHRHPDVGLFLDCDSAILGAEGVRYRAYAAGVRREYSHVPNLLYRFGRARFLKVMLKRPTVFHTSWFEERYGNQARLNLRAELASL